MDGVSMGIVIIGVLLVLVIGLLIESRFSVKEAAEHLNHYDDQLEDVKYSLDVLAQVLSKIPEMMPQMNLINENPLSQILQFFQQMKGTQPQEGSIGAVPLQDSKGRFTDGTKEEQEITAKEIHSD